jgi:hypothetical protein
MRLRFASARQVFEAYPTAFDDIEHEPSDMEPIAFLGELRSSPTPEDAIGFCSYLLPKREAVWWSCQCIRAIIRNPSAEDRSLIEIAENWVSRPEEENRVVALEEGMKASAGGPAAWTALAAAWSGGSLTLEPLRPVPPAPFLTAQAVRAAVLTAIAMVRRPHRKGCLEAAVDTALMIIQRE